MSRGYRLPAVRFKMGRELDCFQTSIRISEIGQVLGHDPRSRAWSSLAKVYPETAELYSTIQRKSPTDRVDALREYIKTRLRNDKQPRVLGALPSLSLGFQSPVAAFEAVDGSPEMGSLVLPVGRRILLDGLQRATAALDFFHGGHPEVDGWFEFAATLYFPSAARGQLSDKDLGQLFFDMNYKQKTMSAVHAMKLDQADPYLQLTNDWAEDGIIKEVGGVEDAASLGKKSTAFVPRKYLFKFVRGALEGRAAQDQDQLQIENPILTDDNYSDWSTELQQYLTDLRSRMGDDKFKDREALHLTSGGWQVLGLIFHDLYVRLRDDLGAADKAQMLDNLAGIDWSRYNPRWIELFGEKEVDNEGRAHLGKKTKWGRKVKDAMLRYVREEVGIASRLPAESPAAEPDDADASEDVRQPTLVSA